MNTLEPNRMLKGPGYVSNQAPGNRSYYPKVVFAFKDAQTY